MSRLVNQSYVDENIAIFLQYGSSEDSELTINDTVIAREIQQQYQNDLIFDDAAIALQIQQEEARVHSHDDNEGLARTLQDLEGNLQLSVSDDEKLARYLQQADELNHSCISQRDGPSTSRAVSHYDDDDHFLGHHIHTHTSSNISISSQNVDANEITDPESMTYEEMNELEDSIGDVSRGLSEGRIFQLRTHKYGTKTKTRWWQIKKKKFIATDTQCSICLVEYMNGDNITTLPCNHIYHKDCISRWLRENKICCICKADV